MNRMLTRLIPLVALALSAAPSAFADHDKYDKYDKYDKHRGGPGWQSSNLTVRNDFDGTVEVWVDGRFMGQIAGNCTQTFPIPAGQREVTVRRAQTGFVLARTRVPAYPGQSQFVPVAAPFGQVTFQNVSMVPMKVLVDGRASWLQPNERVQLTVEAGNVRVSGLLRDCRGEWEALNQTFWLEPGQGSYQALRPESGMIVVTNYERFAVRARIDGVELGFIAPGASERFAVRYGSANLVLVDTAGRTRSTQYVTVQRGREEQVVFGYGRPPGRHGDGYAYDPRPRHDWDD